MTFGSCELGANRYKELLYATPNCDFVSANCWEMGIGSEGKSIQSRSLATN